MQGCICPAGGLPHAGYTLLELLATLSISVLVLTLAVPNFAGEVSRQDIAVQSRVLRASLNAARGEAIMRQRNVYICRRTAEGKCDISPIDRADWTYGWLVFVDDNRNGEWDNADILVKEVTKSAVRTRMFMNHRGRLRFFPDGSARSVGFWFCGGAGEYQYLALLRSGRSRLAPWSEGKNAPECEAESNA